MTIVAHGAPRAPLGNVPTPPLPRQQLSLSMLAGEGCGICLGTGSAFGKRCHHGTPVFADLVTACRYLYKMPAAAPDAAAPEGTELAEAVAHLRSMISLVDRLTGVFDAATVYASLYLREEAGDPAVCVDAEQHQAARNLFAALVAAEKGTVAA